MSTEENLTPEEYIRKLVSDDDYVGYLKVSAIQALVDDDFDIAKGYAERLEVIYEEDRETRLALQRIEEFADRGRNDEQV